MFRIFCLYRAASPDNDTRLQTTDINKTFDLHIKFVYEVIALYQPQEKCLSQIWQSNVVVFRRLHEIEIKGDECEKQALLLNLEFNMEDETHFHILNKMIKKLILIKKIWYSL